MSSFGCGRRAPERVKVGLPTNLQSFFGARPLKGSAVLAPVKAKPVGRRWRAGLDRRCARRSQAMWAGTKKRAFEPNQETRSNRRRAPVWIILRSVLQHRARHGQEAIRDAAQGAPMGVAASP
jgi:hypothetical protein